MGFVRRSRSSWSIFFWRDASQTRYPACRCGLSGTRPDEVHGPYCNVFRQTINLVPGDVAVACFKEVEGANAGRAAW